MAKTLFSATMSLDGFIAGPGGDMSWMTDYLEPDPIVDELIGQVGALLVDDAPQAVGRLPEPGGGVDDPHHVRQVGLGAVVGATQGCGVVVAGLSG